jgi:DNA-binding transcriptional MerR regulator
MSEGEQELLGIQDVASLLGITPRTLRFYEDRGLIEPRRVGAARVYTRRETARMRLILRGKRLGFSPL